MKRKPSNQIDEAPAPPYGARSYWEGRYQSHQKLRKVQESTITATTAEKSTVDTNTKENKSENVPLKVHDKDNNHAENEAEKSDNHRTEDENETELNEENIAFITPAGHAWYFTYEELAPLLIPIILGKEIKNDDDNCDEDNDDDDDDDDDDDGDDDGDGDEEDGENAGDKKAMKEKVENEDTAEKGTTKTVSAGTTINSNEETKNGTEDKKEIENETETETEKVYTEEDRKSLLEIGCGDVPLGIDFAKEKDLCVVGEDETNKKSLLRRIVCCDYSETCIEFLQQQQLERDDTSNKKDDIHNSDEKETNKSLSSEEYVPVEYKVDDARKLPYKNGEFDIVLDKGTLDAMLSDREKGIENCVEIIAEAGRVLSNKGVMVIISHLNASTMDGLKWLDEVVVPGLRKGDGNADWAVESHGADDGIEEEEEDEEVEIDLEEGSEHHHDNADNEDCDAGEIESLPSDVEAIVNDGEGGERGETNNDENDGIPNTKSGPAVYIIHKNGVSDAAKSRTTNTDDENPKTIPLKFFSY